MEYTTIFERARAISAAILRRHWAAILTLAAMAIIVASPLIIFPFYAGDLYQGINIAHFGNDEHYYLTRAKEVLEGHGLGTPHLAEGKDQLDPYLTNIEQILLSPIVALGFGHDVDPATVYNVFNFFGVLATLVLMYLFIYGLSRDILLSCAAVLFAIGAYTLVQYGTVVGMFLTGRDIIYSTFNVFGRSIYPYTALVPFFGFLILTYRAAFSRFLSLSAIRSLGAGGRENFTPYAYVLGAGALFGFSFYIYFYAWTFSLAFLGSLFLSALIFRRWHAAIAAVGIGAVGLIIGSPKLLGLYQFYSSEMGEQLSYFFLSINNRDFIMSNTGLALFALFALYVYLRREDHNNFFLLGIIGAGWVALEQQMITGHTVQYGHYYWYFVVPLSILLSIYMVANLFPREWKSWRRMFLSGLIVVALAYSAAGQYNSFFTSLPWKMREQDFVPILEKLNQLPYGVVLGDPGGASYPLLVAIYTDNDMYWSPGALTSYVSMEYYREVIQVYLYLHKDARRDPVGYLTLALSSSTPNSYVELYEGLEAFKSGIPRRKYLVSPPNTDPDILAIRPQILQEFGSSYWEFAHSVSAVRASLEKRGVRYILWDKRENPELDLTPFGPLEVIATSTDIILYALPTTE